MTIPASRLTDTVRCTKHGLTGPVVGPGAPAVYISSLPAAHLTDVCITFCAVPHVSPLAEGAAKVLIHGLPAARIGNKTLDGSTLKTGDSSVLIGGPGFSLPAFLTIGGDATYQAKVLAHLYLISNTRSGQAMLASMAETGHHLTIDPPGPEDKPNHAYSDPQVVDKLCKRDNPDAFAEGKGKFDDGTGKGTDSRIAYDPDTPKLDYNPPDAPWGVPPDYSADTSLFHEMVHSDDMMHGRMDDTPVPNSGYPGLSPGQAPDMKPASERRAVGLSPYDDANKYPYSENTYRSERGKLQRDWY